MRQIEKKNRRLRLFLKFKWLKSLIFLAVFWMIWGCALKPPEVDLPAEKVRPLFVPVSAGEAVSIVSQGLEAQGLESWTRLEKPLKNSLDRVRKRPSRDKALCLPELCFTWQDLEDTLETLLVLLPDVDRNPELLEYFFDFYALNPDILLTGYYEPLLKASRQADQKYRYPVYALPDDLLTADLGRFHPRWEGQTLTYRIEENRIAPYYDRKSIDQQGALAGQGLELAWVDDPVDLFFLHIQGSGRLEYPDGTREHALYAGKNGRAYVALGRVLAEQGHLEPEEISMQSIREFLWDNENQLQKFLNTNPSYVFFRLEDHGPVGSAGHVLTPFVSVAADPDIIPQGTPLILDAGLPEYKGRKNRVTGPVLVHDTGGAIKGRHLDLFCGFGDRAEYLAGH
ncbi:MAG: murein transglycosylase A, partial [Desulfonatronovibrionaceae bacterium]